MYQQVCGFLECGMLSKLLYWNSPISQNTIFTIHVGNGTVATSRVTVPDVKGYQTGILAQSGDVDGFFSFRTRNDRKLALFSFVL